MMPGNNSPVSLHHTLSISLGAMLLLSAPAIAQCEPTWLAGDGVPGVAGVSAHASCVWDPDGAGPAVERLIVGGWLTGAGGRAVKNIASFNGSDWQPMGELNALVESLVVYQDTVAAGLEIPTPPSLPPAGTASVMLWDGIQWQPLGGDQSPNGPVRILMPFEGGLVAGGTFTKCGATDVDGIAYWNGTSWQALGTPVIPNSTNNTVSGLAVYNGQLISSGSSLKKSGGGSWVKYTARWAGGQWAMLPGAPNVDGPLTVHQGELIVAAAAKWNGSTWTSLVKGVKVSNSSLQSLLSHQGTLYAAGTLPWDNSALMAEWTVDGWKELERNVYGDRADSLCEYRGKLIVAGGLNYAAKDDGVQLLANIAEWDAQHESWSTLAGDINGAGTPNIISPIVSFDGGVVLSSLEYVAVGQGKGRVRLWKEGAVMDAPALGDAVSSIVTAGVVHNGQLITNMMFQGGIGMAWDGQTWTPLGDGLGGNVQAFLSYGPELLAFGQIHWPDGMFYHGAARFDGVQWHPLGNVIPNSTFYHAILHENEVVASYTKPDQTRQITRLIGGVWQPMGSPISGWVDSLVSVNGELFFSIDSTVLRWDGQAWKPVSTPPNLRHMTSWNGRLVGLTTDQNMHQIVQRDGETWHAIGEPVYSIAVGEAPIIAMGDELFLSSPGALPDGRYVVPFLRLGCTCQADCDRSGSLDIDDFVCFQTLFALGEPGADCDGSGQLNIDDFVCFQTVFAVGC